MKKRQAKKLLSRIFNPSTIEARRIIKEISQLISIMSADYIRSLRSNDTEILDQLRLKYERIFDARSKAWGDRLATSALQASEIQFKEAIRDYKPDFSIGKMDLSKEMHETFKLITDENAALFKTIPQQYHAKVSSVVFNAFTQGEGAKDVYAYIKKFDNKTKNYTQLRTLDQTRKAFSALSRERMVAAGIKKFEWIHSGGVKEPRKLHLALSGKVFDIDNPPYIGDMYGVKVYGYPGQLPNCHCKQRFVFADID